MKTREEVVNEAASWIGTPVHQNAMVKGAGVDCGRLLYAVYRFAEIIPAEDAPEPDDPSGPVTGRYSPDWYCNTTEERYLRRAMRYAALIAETFCTRSVRALPGSLALVKCVGSKLYNHGGIVVSWPHVIHLGYHDVEQICVMHHRNWTHKEVAIFDPWEKAA